MPRAALPCLCADPPGQDRAAFRAGAIAFFSAALAGTPP